MSTCNLGRLNVALVFSERNLGLVKSERATTLASRCLQSFERVCRDTLLGRNSLLVQPCTADDASLKVDLVCISYLSLVFGDQLPFLVSDLRSRRRNLRLEILHLNFVILLVLF